MPDPDMPPGSGHVRPDATQPRRPSARDQWAQLVSSTHTPRRWAVIAAGILTADAVRTDEFGAPVERGDEAWCRVAVTALESPAGATAAQHLPDALPQRCLAEADLLLAWLTAPAPYAHDERTIADGLDLVDWRTASFEATHQAVDNLLTQAQDAGVFGVGGYRIELNRLVDPDDWHAGYLLVARPEFGPGLASTPLADDDLVPERATSTLDEATKVLASAAAIVDATLDLRDAAQPAFSPRPAAPGQTRWGQAFRSSADSATTDAAGPARAVPDPPASTRTPRAR
jgi:hypothetical protein